MYDLSSDTLSRLSKIKLKFPKRAAQLLAFFAFTAVTASVFGFLAGVVAVSYFSYNEVGYWPGIIKIGSQSAATENISVDNEKEYLPQTSQEQAIVDAVKKNSPAVVSIIISKDVPVMEQYYIDPFEGSGSPFGLQIPQYRQKGVEKKQIGGGTGFIVSDDGMVLTNKHVVMDDQAEYTVLTNDGRKFDAKVLAKDPFQDLAILKIEKEQSLNDQGVSQSKPFPVVKLGNSDRIKIGQSVIAIGNALGEFRNTVSSGVISGLGRTITASGGGLSETIEDVIQTDAAINSGNSGGPLLNLTGEVIGVNMAKADNAQNIGFALPINYAKKDIEQVKTLGKITPPYLGIYYTVITDKIKEDNKLSVNYGAWLGRNDYGKETETAVAQGSSAEKAGLKRNDIILEFGGEKITAENSLKKLIGKYNPGDKVILKILRGQEYKNIEVVLGERSE